MRHPGEAEDEGTHEARTWPSRRGTDDPPGTHPTATTVDPSPWLS